MTALYEDYHINCAFDDFGLSTFQGDKAAAAYPDAVTTLDFGCGNGLAVERMRQAGREWYGIEYSQAAYEQHLSQPYFYLGDTQRFEDGQFDLIYSTEVMEHIPEDQVEAIVGDLCRVAAKYIFMTISLRPSSQDNRFHCTLKSRTWWEAKFVAHGFLVDRHIVSAFQWVKLRTTKQIQRKWAHFGPKTAAFAANPPYPLHGETEPWFFAFRRRTVAPTKAPKSTVSWRGRTVNPWLHKLLRLDRAA